MSVLGVFGEGRELALGVRCAEPTSPMPTTVAVCHEQPAASTSTIPNWRELAAELYPAGHRHGGR